MVSPVLGIDLGTTNSVVAYADDARVRVLRDEAGRLLTPSIVAFPPSGEVKVGHAARELRLRDPHNTIYSVKRLLGRPFDSGVVQAAAQQLPFILEKGPTGGVLVKVRGESLALPEVSSFILRQLRQIAERRLQVSCGQAVITVPANFNELQRMATRDAAHIAGIEVLRILNEPTAAALAYGYRAHQSQRIAVYDFGGGTFDISILELSGDVIEVVSTAGDSSLGGDDLDRAVADRIAARYAEQFGTQLALTQQTYARLVMASERIKCQLSKRDATDVTIKKLAGADSQIRDFGFRLEQRELTLLADPYIARTFVICEEALRLASIRPSQLDAVLLVGGQTRMPHVRARVGEFFGMQAQCSVDPDLAVAQGAAIQGFALSGSIHALNADGSEPPLDLDEMSAEDAFGEEPPRASGQGLEAGFDDEPTAVARRVSPSEPKFPAAPAVPSMPSIRPERGGSGLSQTLAGMGTAPAVNADTVGGKPVSPQLAAAANALDKSGKAASKTVPGRRPGAAARSSQPAEASAGSSEVDIEISEDDDEDELPPALRSSQPVPRANDIMSTLLDSPRAKARGKSTPAAAGTSERPKAGVVEARALARQGKIDEALRMYGDLLLQDPNDPRLMQEARTLRDMRSRLGGDTSDLRAQGAPAARGGTLDTVEMRALRDPRKTSAPPDAGTLAQGAARGINETVDMRALRDTRTGAGAGLSADTSDRERSAAAPRGSAATRSPRDGGDAASLRDPRTAPEPTDAWQRTEARALNDPRAPADAASIRDVRGTGDAPKLGGIGETTEMRALRDPRRSSGAGLNDEEAGETADSSGLRDPRRSSDAGLNVGGIGETVEMRALRDPRKSPDAQQLDLPPLATGSRGTQDTVDMRSLKDLRAQSAPIVSLELGEDATHERPTAAPPKRADSSPGGARTAATGHWSDAQEEDLSLLAPSLPPQHGSGLPAVNSQLPAPRTRAPLLLDVTPHTLNVETVEGFCEALVERNAPIPTEQTRIFTTSQDQQRTVSVRVSQGESRRTEDNHVLGHIELIELRRAARGEVQIAVTFVIDADGTLSARAVDQATGRSQELRVRLTGAIDPDELERMRASGRKRSS